MYGAIMGDIVGAPYEFERAKQNKDFEMFNSRVRFTDDSVMTVATAEAMLDVSAEDSDDSIRNKIIKSFKKWGRMYPHAGYGSRFALWLITDNTKPYGSFGNGSAMRVSSVGWLFDTLEDVLRMAALSADVTHNHIEGIKGAQSTAAAIYLARTGKSKDYIKEYISEAFGYDLSLSCDEIRPYYEFEISCQKTVPQALTAFFEGKDFEDVVRTAVSLGGDCDTLTCIASGIAEAYYGFPEKFRNNIDKLISAEMKIVINAFYDRIKN